MAFINTEAVLAYNREERVEIGVAPAAAPLNPKPISIAFDDIVAPIVIKNTDRTAEWAVVLGVRTTGKHGERTVTYYRIKATFSQIRSGISNAVISASYGDKWIGVFGIIAHNGLIRKYPGVETGSVSNPSAYSAYVTANMMQYPVVQFFQFERYMTDPKFQEALEASGDAATFNAIASSNVQWPDEVLVVTYLNPDGTTGVFAGELDSNVVGPAIRPVMENYNPYQFKITAGGNAGFAVNQGLFYGLRQLAMKTNLENSLTIHQSQIAGVITEEPYGAHQTVGPNISAGNAGESLPYGQPEPGAPAKTQHAVIPFRKASGEVIYFHDANDLATFQASL